MGYLKDTIKGLSWVSMLRVSTRALAFVKTAIIARILLPSQFGVFGIAVLVLAFLETITETGINVFLVQEDDIDKYIDTAWIVSIGRGILITIIILCAAPLIILFFHSPESKNVLLLTSLIPLIRGFINPSVAKFQKELRFKREYLYRLPIYFLDALVATVLALITKNTTSFIYGLIFGAILEVILSFVVISPKPKFRFDLTQFKLIVSKGKWVTAFGFFDYLFTNLNGFVVGRVLGEGPLGIFQVSSKISSLPISEVSDVVSRVTFPVYSKISGDLERLKKAMFKTFFGLCAIVIPFGILVFIFSKEIVLVLLGENWLESVNILKILALYGIVRGIFYPLMAVFLSVGKQMYVSIVTLVGTVVMGVCIIPLVNKYGLVGAGASTLIGSASTLPFIIYFLVKVFKGEKK